MKIIASPLNPAYTTDEFLFYLEDAKSTVMIVPPGSIKNNYAAVLAAQQQRGIHVVEMFWDGASIVINTSQSKASLNFQPMVFNPQPENVALLLHTSGTTGRPKGVPLSHLNLTTSMKNIIKTYKLTQNDRTLLVMPLFHIHGLVCGLLATLLSGNNRLVKTKNKIEVKRFFTRSGGTAVIPQKFSASNFWTDYNDNRCNWYTAGKKIFSTKTYQTSN